MIGGGIGPLGFDPSGTRLAMDSARNALQATMRDGLQSFSQVACRWLRFIVGASVVVML